MNKKNKSSHLMNYKLKLSNFKMNKHKTNKNNIYYLMMKNNNKLNNNINYHNLVKKKH
jgi:hypothetical protein